MAEGACPAQAAVRGECGGGQAMEGLKLSELLVVPVMFIL
jgi:hypothetical protein